MTLTKSHVAGPATPAVREMTFGDLLRTAAEAAPDRLALIAGVPDPKTAAAMDLRAVLS